MHFRDDSRGLFEQLLIQKLIMKSLINSKAGAMLLVFMALSGTTAWADVDDFVLSVRDVTQPTASTIEFNLYLRDADNAQPFEFAALQLGLLLNSSIYGAGTLTVSYSNTGSGLDGDQQFVGSIDVVAPLAGYDGKTLIRLMANSIPPVPPGAGSGTLISSTGSGTLLAHFTITSSVSFTPNTRAGLEFCSGSAVSPLWATVVYSYIDGNSTPLPVTPGLDAIVNGDPLLNPRLPALFDLTGGEPYCTGAGGSLTGLSGSELDAAYTVYRNGFPVGTINGTGNALSFGLQPASTLTVRATNIAGTVQMNGELVITAIPTNTISLTSGAGSNNQAVCINTAMTNITFSTTGATGASFSGLPAGVTGNWAAGVVTISGTPTEAGTNNYTVTLTGGCGTASATGTITVNALPSAAGSISGSPSFTPGTSGVPYSVGTIASATSYIWSYSGTGVIINGTGASVTLDFSASASSGTLSVFGRNSCGDGSASTLDLSPSTKTLTLTSVLLEGLYAGGGTMREVTNGYNPQFPGIADRVTIELHDAASYSTIVYSVPDVNLSLTGTATVTVPAAFSGSYYITVKHRNSLETTTSVPVTFAGTTINQSFGARTDVFGDNLKSSGDGFYLIFGADVNQDGLVDTGDMNDVDNGSSAILIGYNVSDTNGDGIVDTSDMNMVDNNSAAIVYIRIPF